MKHKLLILLMIAFSAQAWSQEGPVAVDDYAYAQAGDTITINVLENDYHPDGLNYKISVASNCLSHTDSTITYYIDYGAYRSGYMLQDTLAAVYVLIDENGFNGEYALGLVEILIEPVLCCNYLDINNIKTYIQPFDNQFYRKDGRDTTASFEFPKGSGKSTLNCTALWVAGTYETNTICSSMEMTGVGDMWYNPGPFSIDGIHLSTDYQTILEWTKVWKLTKEQVEFHALHYWEESYEPNEDISTWPAHGDPTLHQAEKLAPFVDVDGDGQYNPMLGDYPLIRGDQCIFFIIQDGSPPDNNNNPYHHGLGIECHVMAYEFYNENSPAMNNTVFLSYKIYNRSAYTYDDTYIGWYTYFAIGSMLDDYLGCDVSRGAFYGYNGDDYDEGGYGENPPAQAVVLLGGPLMDANGVDDPQGQCNGSINGVGFGDGIIDNERYGMSYFTSFNSNYYLDSINIQGTPYAPVEIYNCLQGKWKDTTNITYGGSGCPATGSYGPDARFMYPGLSDPCNWGTVGVPPNGPLDWTEISAGNLPGNRYGTGSMGPFTFEPGTMERIDVAYVASFADPGETAVETLMRSVDEVRAKYLENPTYFGYQWLGMEENQIDPIENKLIVFPNPVTNKLTFSCYGKDGEVNYRLTNMMGKTEMRGQTDSNESHTLDVSALNPGIYILSITSKNGTQVVKVIKNH